MNNNNSKFIEMTRNHNDKGTIIQTYRIQIIKVCTVKNIDYINIVFLNSQGTIPLETWSDL